MLEIPQNSVATLIGKQASTINALKTYSKPLGRSPKICPES